MGSTSLEVRRIVVSMVSVVVACLALAGGALAVDNKESFKSKQKQDEFITATLKKMAAEMNSQTPIQIDEDTSLTSAIAFQKTFTVNMRLPRLKYSDVDPKQIIQTVRETLNQTACQSKAVRELIDLGVEYVYIYISNDAKLVARIEIKSYRC